METEEGGGAYLGQKDEGESRCGSLLRLGRVLLRRRERWVRREERRQALGSQDGLEQGKKWSEGRSHTAGCEEEMTDRSRRAGPCLESGLEWIGGSGRDLKCGVWSSPQTCRPSPFPGPPEPRIQPSSSSEQRTAPAAPAEPRVGPGRRTMREFPPLSGPKPSENRPGPGQTAASPPVCRAGAAD